MPFSARQLMVRALELKVLETLDADGSAGGLSAAALSLDPPLATVTYRWPDGSLTLRCGRAGLAGRAYLQVGAEPEVVVVGRGLYERAVESDPREWRDRRLFALGGIESDRVQIEDGLRRTAIVRDGRVWRMEEPARTRVDPVVRDALVQAIGRASSNGYIVDQPEDLERFDLAAPQGRLTVTSTVIEQRDGEVVRTPVTQQLLVGGRIGGSQDRFGMMAGTPVVFRLPAEALVALFRDPRELADPTGCGTLPADVKAIVIRHEQEPELVLERDVDLDADRWIAPNPGSAGGGGPEVAAAAVEELLNQLTELRAPKVEIQEYPSDLQVATVTLLGYDRRPLDTVRVARDPETGEWGLENGDGVVRVLPESAVLRLTRDELGL
jgi:hypothetical protein